LESAAVAVAEPAPVVAEAPAEVPHLELVSTEAPPAPVAEAVVEVAAESKPALKVPEIDAFGRDADFEAKALKALEPIYRRYFRVETRGLENVPTDGPVLLVANHSGAMPWDGAMLKCALAFDHPAHRTLRPLAENLVFHFPFLGVYFNRFGAVRANQENAEALLQAGEAVAVFPEGVKGIGKPFGKRYQLQRFGRGGFVKLAVRTKTPIIPVAIVGAEETHPLLGRLTRPVSSLGLPYLPITPTFPLFGALGLLPLPTKWTIEFGQPLTIEDSQVSDELGIEKVTEDVRSDIQSRIDRLLSQRKSWFT
jgi:1-acyl-sn-glycerol-3-phosphate acyltransferase